MTDHNVTVTITVTDLDVKISDGVSWFSMFLYSQDTLDLLEKLGVSKDKGTYTANMSDEAFDKALWR
jgi:hypothetical protein